MKRGIIMSNEETRTTSPGLAVSIGVFLGIVAILIFGITVLKADLHVLLILGIMLTGIVSVKYGFRMEDLVKGMQASISRAFTALVIFILIGGVIGTWISSGTVPVLIYYGLEFVNPRVFLPAGLIVCSITSMTTGTSWGTVGTVGLALMGMGLSLGIPAPLIAGMIVSGAFFGDKMSPVSDTTNLAAVSAGTDLYAHIASMLSTTVPAYMVSLVIYTIMGWKYGAADTIDAEQMLTIQTVLSEKFTLSPMLLLPVIILIAMSVKKAPAIVVMLTGIFLAGFLGIIVQGQSLSGLIAAINYGYTEATGIVFIDELLLRGGIQNMMWTFSLSFIALCLGGVMETVGYLTVIIERIVSKVKSIGSLVALVICTTIISNAAMGEIYLSIILNGSLYRETFEARGLNKSMLSRLLEEGGTCTGVLIPWVTAGAFVSTTLGVSALSYAPYAFLNYLTPLFSIVFAYMGLFILREEKETVKDIESM